MLTVYLCGLLESGNGRGSLLGNTGKKTLCEDEDELYWNKQGKSFLEAEVEHANARGATKQFLFKEGTS